MIAPQIAKFMGPTWGPPGSYRPQMGPMLAPWTLLSGINRSIIEWHSGLDKLILWLSNTTNSCIYIHIYIFRFNSLRPRRYRRHFTDAIFKCIFLNENEWISLRISLKFVPKVRINNIPSLVQIMAWCRPGDKQLSEPIVVILLTHICVTRTQWYNTVIITSMAVTELTKFISRPSFRGNSAGDVKYVWML